LKLGDRYFVRVQGRRTADEGCASKGLRAPSYRVLLAFLIDSDLLAAPSRFVATETDVSPQTAITLRRRLAEEGLVVEAGKRRYWAPRRRKDAVALWLAGFTASLLPNILLGRFRSIEKDPVELEHRIEPLLDRVCDWRYGGGAAAMRLTGYYRGNQTVLYLRNEPSNLQDKLRLVRDARGPILLLRAPGRQAFRSPIPRCVHPLLAYADLLSEGHDRAREAAGELYTQYLAKVDVDH
jgi:hypothetical protein